MRIISSDKFTNVNASFRTMVPLERSTITKMNLLLYMIRQKTEKFPTKQALTTALVNNYATKAGASLTSFGNQLLFDLRFQWIRPDWIADEGYEKRVCLCMEEILEHPLFDQAGLDEAKYMLENRLLRQMDDPNALSLLTAFSLVDKDSSLSIPVQGSLDDLEKITLEEMEELYAQIQKKPKHVYACGVISEPMKAFLAKYDSCEPLKNDYTLFSSDQFYTEEKAMDISQTSISLLYQTQVALDSDLYFPLLVMNALLGQAPNSMLFTEVREKNSFCYSIYSQLIRLDGVLYISTGTNRKSIAPVLEEIDRQIQRLREGDFSLEQMDIAKKDLKDGLVSGQDSGISLIEQQFLDDLLGRQTCLEERLAAIDAVSVEQIQEVAQQLKAFAQAIIEEADDETV